MKRILLFFLLVCCVQLLPAQTDTLATHHLSEATVKAARLLFVSKGDTLVYDLDALTLENNATLGQALLALPGVDMRKGELYYKGKKVDRLLVNDFDFSISDPQRALSQLPAYLMKQVKAYERLPDKQRRMGYDDGQREVVLNVLVRRKYMGVWTGQATVGAGTSARWETRGYANTFVPRWRISAFGNANNIGRELWYSGDGREVPGSNGSTGKNQYVAPGLTFMCNSGKQEYTPGYWKVDISADYNDNQTYQASRQEEEMFLDKAHRYTAQRSESRGGERRWAGHSSFVWTPHAKSTVAYNANVYINRLHSNLNGLSGEWASNPFLPGVNVLDTLQQNEEAWPAQMILHRKLARQLSGDEKLAFDHLLSANYNVSSSFQLFVRHMLISEQNQGEDFSLDSYRYYSSLTKPKELFHRYRQRDNSSLFTSSCFDFHLALGKGLVLGGTYDLRTDAANDRDDGFRLDRLQDSPFAQFSMAHSLLGTLPTDDYPYWKDTTLDETISRKQPSKELTHRANAWLRYAWGDNHLSFNFDHPWQCVTMDYTQGKQTTQHWQETRRPWSVEATLIQGVDSIGKVYAKYRLAKQYPSLLDLYRPADHSQPLRIVMGNPHLRPTYYHQLAASYSRSFHHSAQHRNSVGQLYVLSQTHLYRDGQQQAATFDRKTGILTTRPINVDWQVEQNSSVQYDWPLTADKRWTMQVYLFHQYNYGMHYATTQSLDEASLLRTHTHHSSVHLRPQYNRKGFRVSLSYRGDWLHQHGAHLEQGGLSLFAHTLRLDGNLRLPAHFECTARLNHYSRFGYESEKGDLHQTLFELSFSRAFLRDRSLLLRLACVDIFGQNNGYRTMISAVSYQRNWSETLGRYFLLSLSWRFSTQKDA